MLAPDNRLERQRISLRLLFRLKSASICGEFGLCLLLGADQCLSVLICGKNCFAVACRRSAVAGGLLLNGQDYLAGCGKMFLWKAPQQTATVIPSDVRTRQGRTSRPCPGVPWRDPENPTNTHALVTHFHQDVPNLTVMLGNGAQKHTVRTQRKYFDKTARMNPNYTPERVLRQRRYDSTIGILRLRPHSSSLGLRSG
jgi:hypothetical protein